MKKTDDLSGGAFKKLSPSVRRKFLANAVGVTVGACAALAAPKSHAILGLSMEELLEKFFDKAGSVLMMFVANRFYKNFIEGFDKYTEMNNDSTAKESGLLGGTFQNSMDFEMNFSKNLTENQLSRKTETPPRICKDTQQSGIVMQSTESNTANMSNISKGQSQMLFNAQVSNKPEYRSSYIELVNSTIGDGSVIDVSHLSQIFGTGAFNDVGKTQAEFTLMLADILPSPDESSMNWMAGVNEDDLWKTKGSQSSVVSDFRRLGRSVQANVLIEAISYAMARRVPSKSLTEALSSTLLAAGKNKSDMALSGTSSYLCAVEALMLEIESKSLEPGYIKEMNNYSDPTPVLYYLNGQMSLQNKIKHERLKILKLRNNVAAVSAILDSQISDSQ